MKVFCIIFSRFYLIIKPTTQHLITVVHFITACTALEPSRRCALQFEVQKLCNDTITFTTAKELWANRSVLAFLENLVISENIKMTDKLGLGSHR